MPRIGACAVARAGKTAGRPRLLRHGAAAFCEHASVQRTAPAFRRPPPAGSSRRVAAAPAARAASPRCDGRSTSPRVCAWVHMGGLVWVHMKRGAVDLTFPPSAAAISSRNRTRSVAVAFGAPSAAKGPPADPRAHSCHAALLDVAASPRASLACACLCPPSLPGGRRCSTLCTGILQRCLLRRGRTWPHILPVQRVRAGGQRPTPHGGRMARFRARHVDRRVRISTRGSPFLKSWTFDAIRSSCGKFYSNLVPRSEKWHLQEHTEGQCDTVTAPFGPVGDCVANLS